LIGFVEIKQSVIDSILSYAKMAHPNEGILLLRGRTSKDRIVIEEVVIPPFATHGKGFESFPLFMLPIDFSIVGVAHSHPIGVLNPSTYDLNQFYGRVMVIIVYPYESERDIAVFDREGRSVSYRIA
jgi:proteasome lid subunit RPN8/RPN11